MDIDREIMNLKAAVESLTRTIAIMEAQKYITTKDDLERRIRRIEAIVDAPPMDEPQRVDAIEKKLKIKKSAGG